MLRGARARPARVLLVEDDDVFAATLTELLQADRRIEVAGRARDGREGIDLVEQLDPDLVLMDVVLPVLDGVAATRELRRRRPDVPVIALTGWDYEERALEVREAGAAEFIRKGRLSSDLAEIVLALARPRPRPRWRAR